MEKLTTYDQTVLLQALTDSVTLNGRKITDLHSSNREDEPNKDKLLAVYRSQISACAGLIVKISGGKF